MSALKEPTNLEQASSFEYDEKWVDKLLNDSNESRQTIKSLKALRSQSQILLEDAIKIEKKLDQSTSQLNVSKNSKPKTAVRKKSSITAIEKQQLAWSVKKRMQKNASLAPTEKTKGLWSRFKI